MYRFLQSAEWCWITRTFSDVHAVNGKIVDDGNRSVVVGYALPGFSESLGTDALEIPETVTVSADVKKI